MTNLQSSVDPAFSMFLEERRKEEKARADRARILRATNKNRNKRTTGVGRIDRAKTDAINARRSEMNVNQTSGTAAQRAATADRQANRRAPEHHVVTDASGNQTSVLGPRPESVQASSSPGYDQGTAVPKDTRIVGPPSPKPLPPLAFAELPSSNMGPPTAEDQVNQIMRMMERDPGGVPNPNRNMMFTSNDDAPGTSQQETGRLGPLFESLVQDTTSAASGIRNSVNDYLEEKVAANREREKARFNSLSEEEQDAEIAANEARTAAAGQTFDFLDPWLDGFGEVSSEMGGILNDKADAYLEGETEGYGSLTAFVLKSLAETVMPEPEFPPSFLTRSPDEETTKLLEQREQSQIDHGERMREIKSAREDRALSDQYHRDRQFSVSQTLRNNPNGMAVPEGGFPQSFEEYKAREQQKMDEFKKREQEAFENLARMGGF